MELKVKPLEWRKLYENQTVHPMDWHGRGVLDTLFVITQEYRGGKFYALGKGFDTLEKAKDATQSHYDKAVLSALSTPHTPTGE